MFEGYFVAKCKNIIGGYRLLRSLFQRFRVFYVFYFFTHACQVFFCDFRKFGRTPFLLNTFWQLLLKSASVLLRNVDPLQKNWWEKISKEKGATLRRKLMSDCVKISILINLQASAM